MAENYQGHGPVSHISTLNEKPPDGYTRVRGVVDRRFSVLAFAVLTFFLDPAGPSSSHLHPPRSGVDTKPHPSCVRTQRQYALRRNSKRCHWCLNVLESHLAYCVVVYGLVVTGGGQGCTGVTMSIFFFSNHERGHWQGDNCCGCCHPRHGCCARHRRSRPQEQVPRVELLVLERHTRPREQVACGFQLLSVKFLQQLHGKFIARVHNVVHVKHLKSFDAMLSQMRSTYPFKLCCSSLDL